MKRIIFFISILLIFAGNANGQFGNAPRHPQSKLIEKSTEKIGESEVNIYKYSCQIPKEEVINFYREMLSGQGWKESEEARGYFIKGKETLALEFSPVVMDGELNYMVIAGKHKDVPRGGGCSSGKCSARTKGFSFKPVYPGAEEVSSRSHPKGISYSIYKIPAGPEPVTGFYLEKMPSSGWVFLSQEMSDFQLNFADICPDKDCSPFPELPAEQSKMVADFPDNLISPPQDSPAPPESIKLTFKKNNNICDIFITLVPSEDQQLLETESYETQAQELSAAKEGSSQKMETMVGVYYYEKK